MSRFEWKALCGSTLLGIFASYANDHTVLEKALLIGGPCVAWLCLRSFIRSILR